MQSENGYCFLIVYSSQIAIYGHNTHYKLALSLEFHKLPFLRYGYIHSDLDICKYHPQIARWVFSDVLSSADFDSFL